MPPLSINSVSVSVSSNLASVSGPVSRENAGNPTASILTWRQLTTESENPGPAHFPRNITAEVAALNVQVHSGIERLYSGNVNYILASYSKG